MNQLEFVGQIVEREVLRFTPAGVPIVSAVLTHRSQQIEAGAARQVEFEIIALAAGEISGRFSQAEMGATHLFTGFLARKNRNSKSLVFHLIDFRAAD